MDIILLVVISLVFIIVCLQAWWISRSIKKFLLIRDLFEDVYVSMTSYLEHLNHVHSLERYYGDETLESLVEHGETTATSVEEFLEVFSEFSELGTVLLPEEDEGVDELYGKTNEEE